MNLFQNSLSIYGSRNERLQQAYLTLAELFENKARLLRAPRRARDR